MILLQQNKKRRARGKIVTLEFDGFPFLFFWNLMKICRWVLLAIISLPNCPSDASKVCSFPDLYPRQVLMFHTNIPTLKIVCVFAISD